MHQLQRGPPCQQPQVPILETPLLQGVAHKESPSAQRNPSQLNSLNCEWPQTMIKHNLAIFSQNVRKSRILTDTILETQKTLSNIIFIQEPLRFLIRRIPSHTDPYGDLLYRTSNHPNWSLFIQNDLSSDNFPCVATYINKCLAKLRFSLRLNIINHCDINVIAFHNH